jgi:ElaB/YqjD/DUF883 family membrane-anchored ribosome-binding protein
MANSSLNEIADDVSEAVLRALHRLGAETSDASRQARRTFDRTGKHVSHIADELWHDTRVQGRKAANTAVSEIRARPFTALALGAVLGAVAATLLARRD